jgi:hypothetical protein
MPVGDASIYAPRLARNSRHLESLRVPDGRTATDEKTEYRERRTDPEYQRGYHERVVCALLKALRCPREVAFEIYLAGQSPVTI